jgi:hypothetical protein
MAIGEHYRAGHGTFLLTGVIAQLLTIDGSGIDEAIADTLPNDPW